jgi:hypothetical protein
LEANILKPGRNTASECESSDKVKPTYAQQLSTESGTILLTSTTEAADIGEPYQESLLAMFDSMTNGSKLLRVRDLKGRPWRWEMQNSLFGYYFSLFPPWAKTPCGSLTQISKYQWVIMLKETSYSPEIWLPSDDVAYLLMFGPSLIQRERARYL